MSISNINNIVVSIIRKKYEKLYVEFTHTRNSRLQILIVQLFVIYFVCRYSCFRFLLSEFLGKCEKFGSFPAFHVTRNNKHKSLVLFSSCTKASAEKYCWLSNIPADLVSLSTFVYVCVYLIEYIILSVSFLSGFPLAGNVKHNQNIPVMTNYQFQFTTTFPHTAQINGKPSWQRSPRQLR